MRTGRAARISDKPSEVVLVGRPVLERDAGDPVGRLFEPLDHRLELSGLVGIGDEADLDGELHITVMQIPFTVMQTIESKGGRRFLPLPEGRGSSPRLAE